MASHLASLWKRHFVELGNGLFTMVIRNTLAERNNEAWGQGKKGQSLTNEQALSAISELCSQARNSLK